ncbi:MAG: penicillin-binding protein 2 [Actinobacteria bacterium]|nr:penicillin-binding protein 2 [Actinomycetota bacterium]
MGTMTACLGAICVRLFFVQVVHAANYQGAAESEYLQKISYLGERGEILDRNGDVLAMSVPLTTIYADPYQVTNPHSEASALASALGLPEPTLQGELSEASGFVYLAHTVPDPEASEVKKLMGEGLLPGVYTMQQSKRFYPAGQLAKPLLGTVGASGQGLSGLEYKYNSLLSGKPGELVEEVAPGGQIPGGVRQYRAPVPGDDLVLSLDEPLQYDAEEDLARTLIASRGQYGMALIMDSRTGDLLAVAQESMRSASDPATLREQPALPVWFVPYTSSGTPEQLSHVALENAQPVESPTATAFTSVYAPGSVEKLVTMSAALQSGVVTPYTKVQIPNSIDVAGTTINDAWTHPTLDWYPSNIIAHSSDIGTLEIAQRLGLAKLLSYIKAFGIGQVSDIAFPGESAGLVPFLPSQWSGTTITISYGEGMDVTAIQMLDAYNTIANGGVYVSPKLVTGYIGPKGHEHLFHYPAPRRVVSEKVAHEMTSMLEGVVTVGTGQAASIEPYTVAGKTGTSLIRKPGGGHYSGYFTSSFAGFVPAEDPQVTIMVVVAGTIWYGAEASAPVFAMLARDTLQRLRVPPAKHLAATFWGPPATPYGAEGVAAGGLVLPGMGGTPDVQVGTSSGGAQAGQGTGVLH